MLIALAANLAGCVIESEGTDETDDSTSTSGSASTNGTTSPNPSSTTSASTSSSTSSTSNPTTTNAETTTAEPEASSSSSGEADVSTSTGVASGSTSTGSTIETTGDCVVAPKASNPGVIELASAIDTGEIREFEITGSQANISFGDGTPGDADGLYAVDDPTMAFGSLDLFPNEADFVVGMLTYDRMLVCDTGVVTVAIEALDISELWAAGSATTDISDAALSLWFFEQVNDLQFGPLPKDATVTFTDGMLTSIDLALTVSFTTDVPTDDTDPVWSGSLSFAGDAFTLSIDDVATDINTGFFVVPESNLVMDISGTVDAVTP